MSILPALLVGSGLKPKSPLPLLLVRTSPGFIGREWIETPRMNSLIMAINPSPGFIGREWIETESDHSYRWINVILPALLVGSGLKRHFVVRHNSPPIVLPALLVGSGLKPRCIRNR